MYSDPIADLLTRIRNANTLFKPRVEVPASKFKEAVVSLLIKEGYLKAYRIRVKGGKRVMEIVLKYSKKGERVITHLERVSKPGRRKYGGKDEIPRVLNGLGICVLSTSRGIRSGTEAKQVGQGGEILCHIW
jgi:small subunit ribosomal protein S8